LELSSCGDYVQHLGCGDYVQHLGCGDYVQHLGCGDYVQHLGCGDYVQHLGCGDYVQHLGCGDYVQHLGCGDYVQHLGRVDLLLILIKNRTSYGCNRRYIRLHRCICLHCVSSAASAIAFLYSTYTAQQADSPVLARLVSTRKSNDC
jgi:hypothetical protein